MRWLLLFLLLSCAPVSLPVEQPPEPILPIQPAPVVPVQPAVEVVETIFCEDSDGSDIFSRGVTKSSFDSVMDSCLYADRDGLRVPLSRVVEYSCDGDKIVADVFDCEFGCENGACLSSAREKFYLVRDSECKQGAILNDVLSVKNCFNSCLTGTSCEASGVKTSQVSLPWQLSCLARNDEWVVEKWVEFEILSPVFVEFFADVVGSELVRVQIFRDGALVGNVIDGPVSLPNRCFAPVSGKGFAYMTTGIYEVRIGARAVGAADLLRSFKALNFSVSFI